MNNKSTLFKKKSYTISNGKTVVEPRSKLPIILLVLLVMIYFSVQITGFDMAQLIKRASYFFDVIERMIPPDFSYFPEIVTPLIETLAMSIIGSFIGSILAVPAAVLAATNITKSKVVVSVMRFILGITRTLPTLVTALIAVFVFDLGSFAGTVAITIFTFSFVGKLLYQQIETVNMGAYEAMEAMGSTKIRAFWSSIVPQISPTYIANCLYCFEGSVRHSAILGYVGAGGLGLLLNEKLGWKQYDKVGMILLCLLITVAILEIISRSIRKKLT